MNRGVAFEMTVHVLDAMSRGVVVMDVLGREPRPAEHAEQSEADPYAARDPSRLHSAIIVGQPVSGKPDHPWSGIVGR